MSASPQQDELTKITTTLGAGALIIDDLEGEEGLSTLFHYRLRVTSPAEDTDVGSLVATEATVSVQGGDYQRRWIHGVITRVQMLSVEPLTKWVHWAIELRPRLSLLGLGADSRIFQNQSVPDIVSAVLTAQGVTAVEKSLTGTYSAREYCVQYRETHLDFIRRLLESEGIFFFFKHADGAHTLVLGDDSDAHPDVPNTPTLRFRANVAYKVDEDDIISDVAMEQRIVSGAYGVNNFKFETPSTPLYSKVTGVQTALEVNDYPAPHATTDVGEAIARRRLEALEVDAKLLSGSGMLRNLIAGYKFTLSEHAKTALNGAYVVRSLAVRARRGEYNASFTAFPASVPFRPPLLIRPPLIASTQTAMVVGKQGEEQWLDSYGRVKVQFHWDRVGSSDENSSCWVRVAQGLAGKGWGAVFLPRIGHEVVVSFLEGDPDQPLITGAVYNATTTPPYALPTEQTKSTIMSQSTKNGAGKSNELRFEDKLDSEEFYAHAQKDMLVVVENDETRTIKHNQAETITNDATLTVNHDNTITVKNNRSRTVSQGNDTLAVSQGTRSVTVQGNETHTNHANFTQSVDGNHKLTVTGDLTIEVTGALSIKAASITMQSTSGNVGLQSALAFKAESGTTFDLKSGIAMTLSSNLTMDLKAQASWSAQGLTAALKGDTMAEASGGAMLKLSGAIVKIN